MTNKDIEQLINKYLDGKTSPAEECRLARELQRTDIPEEWQTIRLMLGELTLGEAEYDALLAERTAPFRLPRGGEKKSLPSGRLGGGRWLLGIAASVLLLLVFRVSQDPVVEQPVLPFGQAQAEVTETIEQSVPQLSEPAHKPHRSYKSYKPHRSYKPQEKPMLAEAVPQPEEEAPVIPPDKQALVDIFLAEEALQVAYEIRAQQEAIRAYAASLTGEELPQPIIAF